MYGKKNLILSRARKKDHRDFDRRKYIRFPRVLIPGGGEVLAGARGIALSARDTAAALLDGTLPPNFSTNHHSGSSVAEIGAALASAALGVGIGLRSGGNVGGDGGNDAGGDEGGGGGGGGDGGNGGGVGGMRDANIGGTTGNANNQNPVQLDDGVGGNGGNQFDHNRPVIQYEDAEDVQGDWGDNDLGSNDNQPELHTPQIRDPRNPFFPAQPRGILPYVYTGTSAVPLLGDLAGLAQAGATIAPAIRNAFNYITSGFRNSTRQNTTTQPSSTGPMVEEIPSTEPTQQTLVQNATTSTRNTNAFQDFLENTIQDNGFDEDGGGGAISQNNTYQRNIELPVTEPLTVNSYNRLARRIPSTPVIRSETVKFRKKRSNNSNIPATYLINRGMHQEPSYFVNELSRIIFPRRHNADLSSFRSRQLVTPLMSSGQSVTRRSLRGAVFIRPQGPESLVGFRQTFIPSLSGSSAAYNIPRETRFIRLREPESSIRSQRYFFPARNLNQELVDSRRIILPPSNSDLRANVFRVKKFMSINSVNQYNKPKDDDDKPAISMKAHSNRKELAHNSIIEQMKVVVQNGQNDENIRNNVNQLVNISNAISEQGQNSHMARGIRSRTVVPAILTSRNIRRDAIPSQNTQNIRSEIQRIVRNTSGISNMPDTRFMSRIFARSDSQPAMTSHRGFPPDDDDKNNKLHDGDLSKKYSPQEPPPRHYAIREFGRVSTNSPFNANEVSNMPLLNIAPLLNPDLIEDQYTFTQGRIRSINYRSIPSESPAHLEIRTDHPDPPPNGGGIKAPETRSSVRTNPLSNDLVDEPNAISGTILRTDALSATTPDHPDNPSDGIKAPKTRLSVRIPRTNPDFYEDQYMAAEEIIRSINSGDIQAQLPVLTNVSNNPPDQINTQNRHARQKSHHLKITGRNVSVNKKDDEKEEQQIEANLQLAKYSASIYKSNENDTVVVSTTMGPPPPPQPPQFEQNTQNLTPLQITQQMEYIILQPPAPIPRLEEVANVSEVIKMEEIPPESEAGHIEKMEIESEANNLLEEEIEVEQGANGQEIQQNTTLPQTADDQQPNQVPLSVPTLAAYPSIQNRRENSALIHLTNRIRGVQRTGRKKLGVLELNQTPTLSETINPQVPLITRNELSSRPTITFPRRLGDIIHTIDAHVTDLSLPGAETATNRRNKKTARLTRTGVIVRRQTASDINEQNDLILEDIRSVANLSTTQIALIAKKRKQIKSSALYRRKVKFLFVDENPDIIIESNEPQKKINTIKSAGDELVADKAKRTRRVVNKSPMKTHIARKINRKIKKNPNLFKNTTKERKKTIRTTTIRLSNAPRATDEQFDSFNQVRNFQPYDMRTLSVLLNAGFTVRDVQYLIDSLELGSVRGIRISAEEIRRRLRVILNRRRRPQTQKPEDNEMTEEEK